MAAISKNTIARMALSHLGATANIEDMDTEQTTVARQAKMWYDLAREQALADYDWNFARKRVALSLSEFAAPTTEWVFRYRYPADCLRARYIENPAGPFGDDPPFEVEEQTDGALSIVTDVENAVLVFTRNSQAPSVFSAHFVSALSYLLAHYMAGPVTGKDTKKQEMMQSYRFAVLSAAGNEANEGTQRPPRDAEWTRGR